MPLFGFPSYCCCLQLPLARPNLVDASSGQSPTASVVGNGRSCWCKVNPPASDRGSWKSKISKLSPNYLCVSLLTKLQPTNIPRHRNNPLSIEVAPVWSDRLSNISRAPRNPRSYHPFFIQTCVKCSFFGGNSPEGIRAPTPLGHLWPGGSDTSIHVVALTRFFWVPQFRDLIEGEIDRRNIRRSWPEI